MGRKLVTRAVPAEPGFRREGSELLKSDPAEPVPVCAGVEVKFSVKLNIGQ